MKENYIHSSTKPLRQEYRVYNRHASDAEFAWCVVLTVWLAIVTVVLLVG